MYIIAIGWLYVTTLMAFTETSIVAGALTFLFYGLFPMTLLLWLLGTPARRQRRRAQENRALAEVVGESSSTGEPLEASDKRTDQDKTRATP